MAEDQQSISLTDAERPLFAGVDVGGTNIKIGLVDNRGRSLAYTSVPTDEEHGPDDAARRIADGLATMLTKHGIDRKEIARVGLATPGPMDIPSGMLLHPGNLPHWHNTPIRDLVSQSCGLPVTFANDANAAAYGEFWRGAGQQYHSMVLFTLGTGIGGGIIVGDMLIEGTHSCGGELGHLIIDCRDDAPRNSLGIRGTVEGFCGAYAVLDRTQQALDSGRASSLRRRIDAGEELTPLMLAEEAEAGDEFSWEIIRETARYMAIGIVTAVHAIDPDSVVLGGGMTFGGAGHPLGERFLGVIREEAKSRMLAAIADKVSIDFAQLESDAGYIGAAGLARLEHLRNE
ncbi:MAG: ROK family protein [Pirellulales bacterium]